MVKADLKAIDRRTRTTDSRFEAIDRKDINEDSTRKQLKEER